MSQENVEIVRRSYERWNRGDLRWVTDLAGPEFEYVPAGVFLSTGSVRNPEGFMRYLERFWDEFDEPHVEGQEFIDAGDRVFAAVTFSGRGKQSGVPVEMHYFQLWTLRGGKVIRGQAFLDREAALEAAGLRE